MSFSSLARVLYVGREGLCEEERGEGGKKGRKRGRTNRPRELRAALEALYCTERPAQFSSPRHKRD